VNFVLLMAMREIRASWKRLLFFFICIAIGVGSIVALRSVIQNVRGALARETRTLIASDILLSSNNPIPNDVREMVAREVRAGRVSESTDAVEIATMVRPADGRTVARMVELRAVQAAFPFYGTVTLRDGAYSHDRLTGRGVLVRPELLAQLDVHVGDRILIGAQPFEIRGVIATEPGRSLGSFSLGPRVLVDFADLQSTGLLSFGSRAAYQMLLRGPEAGVRDVETRLTDALKTRFVRSRGYWENADRIGEDLTRSENYLSLVGLVILILGGIGVSSVTRVFVQQKVRSIAILKCLGGTSTRVLAIYMAQVIALGTAGSALGVALAGTVIATVPSFVGNLAGELQIDYGLSASAVEQGLAIGILVSLLFSVVPLLEVRMVKPSLLLRNDVPRLGRIDWVKWGVTAGVAVALVGVAAWQAGSLRVGLMLSGGFVGTALVLHAAGVALIWAVQPLRFSRSFALRQAVLHVVRPGNQTRVILLAVGLGSFFILGVRSLQADLLRDLSVQIGPTAPDMFFIDIQPAQRAALTTYLDAQNGDAPPPNTIPVLRARVTGVRGRDVTLDSYEQVRGRSNLSREFTITYRSTLERNEHVVAGQWWAPTPSSEPEVSIEEGFLKNTPLAVGDRISFDVLGRPITARVASIRKVDWQDFRSGGFMFVFRPGIFDNAPQTFIASFKGPSDPDVRARMQAGVVTQFPNVSVIDLREILQTVSGIVGNVTTAVTVVGSLVLLSGALILVGAVSMTKFRRVYEAAILKTLGASGRLIAAMLVLEYGVLGAIAGTVGALGAIVLSWAVATYALELAWTPAIVLTLGGIVVTTIFVAVVGVAASWDVLRRKPLSTLRAE